MEHQELSMTQKRLRNFWIIYHLQKEEEKVKELTAEEIARHEEYKQNLKNKYNELAEEIFFDESAIDELDIGIDLNNNYWFGQHDINGKLIAIQKHKIPLR